MERLAPLTTEIILIKQWIKKAFGNCPTVSQSLKHNANTTNADCIGGAVEGRD